MKADTQIASVAATEPVQRQLASSIPLLDFIRTFAAWAVLAWHLAELVAFTKMPFFSSGAFAVDIFMNVSGFLMFYHYSQRELTEPWQSPKTWKRFWLRRFFRIAPLYYVLLIITFASRDFLRLGTFDLKSLTLHFTFLFGFIPAHVSNSAFPDWSLALEMQFYFLFPLLAVALRKLGCGAFFALTSCTAAVAHLLVTYYTESPPGFLGWLPQPSVLPLKIHIFTVGMIAAEVYLKGGSVLHSRWFIIGIAAFAATCGFNYTRLLGGAYLIAYLLCWNRFTFSWFQDAVSRFNRLCGRLKFFQLSAELSYSCYLIHGVILFIIFKFLRFDSGSGGVSTWKFILCLCLALFVINTIAALFYRWIEVPGIKLGRKLATR